MSSYSRTVSYSSGARLGSGRSPSVYGGAGGAGVRISSMSSPSTFSSSARVGSSASASSSGGFNLADAIDISDNKKMAMQNLNDRLSTYLEKVRKLEAANADLELKIRQFLDKKTKPEGHDWTAHNAVIITLRDQVRPGFGSKDIFACSIGTDTSRSTNKCGVVSKY